MMLRRKLEENTMQVLTCLNQVQRLLPEIQTIDRYIDVIAAAGGV